MANYTAAEIRAKTIARMLNGGVLVVENLPFLSPADLRKIELIAGERNFLGRGLKVREQGRVQEVSMEVLATKLRPEQIFMHEANRLLAILHKDKRGKLELGQAVCKHFKQPVAAELTVAQQLQLSQNLNKVAGKLAPKVASLLGQVSQALYASGAPLGQQ